MKDRNERIMAWAKAHRFAFSLAVIPVVIAINLIALVVNFVLLGRPHHPGPFLRAVLPMPIGIWIGLMLAYHGKWIIEDIGARRHHRTES